MGDKRSKKAPSFPLLALLWTCSAAAAGCGHVQLGDPDYRPTVAEPRFAEGEAPIVAVDEAHNNFHTASGRYAPFARLLGADGCDVVSLEVPLGRDSLEGIDLLVIANALHESDVEEWEAPNPSAFTREEIEAVREWVEGGGRLMLIADHMPFPGAAADLAAAFGFEMINGFAMRSRADGEAFFSRADGTLADHAVTAGAAPEERVDLVKSFTGQVLRIPDGATPIMTMPDGYTSFNPRVAWSFEEDTEEIDASGLFQGAVLEFGEGRLAVFGEAAMFTAQLSGRDGSPMGMNDPEAGSNEQFVLNVVHWLLGAIP